MKLTLHVGPHKTGTSAVQAVLRSRRFLRFHYPTTGQWPDGAHHRLMFSIIPELARDYGELKCIETYIEDLRNELEGVHREHLLISSEFLGHPDKSGESLAKRLLQRLTTAGVIEAQGARALLVCRDHVMRAASLFNQCVKDPVIGEKRSPDQYLLEESKRLRYSPITDRFKSLGLEVEAISYEPANIVVQRVLAAAGAGADEIPNEAPKRNVGLSRVLLVAMLAVNRAMDSCDDRRSHFQALKTIRPAFAASNNLFSPEVIQEVLGSFMADAKTLPKRLQTDLESYRPIKQASSGNLARLTQEERCFVGKMLVESELHKHNKYQKLCEELDELTGTD